MKDEMDKFKSGKMHSGSKTGPKVKSRKQAIAIALSESGQSKKTSDKKKSEGHAKAEKRMAKAANRRSRNKGRS